MKNTKNSVSVRATVYLTLLLPKVNILSKYTNRFTIKLKYTQTVFLVVVKGVGGIFKKINLFFENKVRFFFLPFVKD